MEVSEGTIMPRQHACSLPQHVTGIGRIIFLLHCFRRVMSPYIRGRPRAAGGCLQALLAVAGEAWLRLICILVTPRPVGVIVVVVMMVVRVVLVDLLLLLLLSLLSLKVLQRQTMLALVMGETIPTMIILVIRWRLL